MVISISYEVTKCFQFKFCSTKICPGVIISFPKSFASVVCSPEGLKFSASCRRTWRLPSKVNFFTSLGEQTVEPNDLGEEGVTLWHI